MISSILIKTHGVKATSEDDTIEIERAGLFITVECPNSTIDILIDDLSGCASLNDVGKSINPETDIEAMSVFQEAQRASSGGTVAKILKVLTVFTMRFGECMMYVNARKNGEWKTFEHTMDTMYPTAKLLSDVKSWHVMSIDFPYMQAFVPTLAKNIVEYIDETTERMGGSTQRVVDADLLDDYEFVDAALQCDFCVEVGGRLPDLRESIVRYGAVRRALSTRDAKFGSFHPNTSHVFFGTGERGWFESILTADIKEQIRLRFEEMKLEHREKEREEELEEKRKEDVQKALMEQALGAGYEMPAPKSVEEIARMWGEEK